MIIWLGSDYKIQDKVTVIYYLKPVFFCKNYNYNRRGHHSPMEQVCDCNTTVVGSISTRGNELLFLNIFISSFQCLGKSPLSSATQHAMPRKTRQKVGNGVSQRLGSLCLPCCMRDTPYHKVGSIPQPVGFTVTPRATAPSLASCIIIVQYIKHFDQISINHI